MNTAILGREYFNIYDVARNLQNFKEGMYSRVVNITNWYNANVEIAHNPFLE